MRLIPLILPSIAVSLTACDESRFRGETTVTQVVENIHQMDGKVYRVRGWLGNCGGLDCGLYPSKADAVLVHEGKYDDDWFAAMDRRLSIATMGDFDDRAAPLQFQLVEVTALIDDFCSGAGCTDRASDLIPFTIEPVAKKAEN